MNTDYFSLSQTQRRLAHEYKRWALEDEVIGNLERYRVNRQRSDRLWRSAKANLELARRGTQAREHQEWSVAA